MVRKEWVGDHISVALPPPWMDLLGPLNNYAWGQQKWLKLAFTDSQNSSKMDSSSLRISPTSFTVSFIYLLLLVCTFPASSSSSLLSPDSGAPNRTLDVSSELRKIRRIRDHLRRINKPAVKTIQAIFQSVLSPFRFSFSACPGILLVHGGCILVHGRKLKINQNAGED